MIFIRGISLASWTMLFEQWFCRDICCSASKQRGSLDIVLIVGVLTASKYKFAGENQHHLCNFQLSAPFSHPITITITSPSDQPTQPTSPPQNPDHYTPFPDPLTQSCNDSPLVVPGYPDPRFTSGRLDLEYVHRDRGTCNSEVLIQR